MLNPEYFMLFIIFILVYFIVVQAVNFLSIKKMGKFPPAGEHPFVSVLVPARNEEDNIESCILSLMKQDYPSFEIIVLDDDSEDNTWNTVYRLSKTDTRLHLIKGAPLREGWIGKCWACHQLAKKARGDYLLFVDADTRHDPAMLRSAVDAASFYRTDLLTALPEEKAETLSEALTIPLITWGTFAAFPYPLAFFLQWPALSISVGQFMLFRRDAYDGIGGHESVSDHVTEDMELGRLVISNGLRWRLVNGSSVVKCRMYKDFTDAVNGLSKTLFGALGDSILLVFLLSFIIGAVFCLPPLVLLAMAAGHTASNILFDRTLVAMVLALLTWGVANLHFRLPLHFTFLYPLISALTIYIFFRSMFFSIMGKATWKGRVLSKRKVRWLKHFK